MHNGWGRLFYGHGESSCQSACVGPSEGVCSVLVLVVCEGYGAGELLYVPLGGDHFKAVGSMDLARPRLVSLAFQSSMRSLRTEKMF